MFHDAFQNKRVFLTGHTGFKGSWLSEWLIGLGAEVYGYSLASNTNPSLFDLLGLKHRMSHQIGDVRDAGHLKDALLASNPDFVFHLAAQPLVRRSYAEPVETYETNVMGTIHMLEALRAIQSPCTAILVTTDKCYENREHGLPYMEEDHLGGHDPYSSSKAMAEIAISAYRRSFFSNSDSRVQIASVRAGNVIGGGDWAEDRIVPDCVRAIQSGAPIGVRNPIATRPWQHVLEPLGGYLALAASIASGAGNPVSLNFGPNPDCNRSVKELVVEILDHWPGEWVDQSDPNAVHEARLLSLSIKKAAATIGWSPVWGFQKTILQTIGWYRSTFEDPTILLSLTRRQIQMYAEDAQAAGLDWAG